MSDQRSNEQRFFRKFSQWYYIDARKEMPIPDAPELVSLLQAVGFKLTSMGLSKTASTNSAQKLSGMKVTIECGTSGVVAEMETPPNTECRCPIFKGNNSQADSSVQDQASFWTITASQEKLNGKIGSSLLPEIDANHSRVIKEVFQLLQDDLSTVFEATKRVNSRSRLSLPPVPKFSEDASSSSTSSSVQHSVDSLEKFDGGQSFDNIPNVLIRRASIGCGEELKNVQPLPSKLPPKPKNLLDNSSSSLTDPETPKAVQTSTASPQGNKSDALRKLLTAALKILEPQKGKVPSASRRATFNLPPGESVLDANKKKMKVFGTPGPAKSTGMQGISRMPTPNPASRMAARTSLRSAFSSPMPGSSITGPTAASKAKTVDSTRRRTFIVPEQKSRVSKASVLSPSPEVAEGNVQVVTPLRLPQKSRLAKRTSLPPRPTFNKENNEPAK